MNNIHCLCHCRCIDRIQFPHLRLCILASLKTGYNWNRNKTTRTTNMKCTRPHQQKREQKIANKQQNRNETEKEKSLDENNQQDVATTLDNCCHAGHSTQPHTTHSSIPFEAEQVWACQAIYLITICIWNEVLMNRFGFVWTICAVADTDDDDDDDKNKNDDDNGHVEHTTHIFKSNAIETVKLMTEQYTVHTLTEWVCSCEAYCLLFIICNCCSHSLLLFVDTNIPPFRCALLTLASMSHYGNTNDVSNDFNDGFRLPHRCRHYNSILIFATVQPSAIDDRQLWALHPPDSEKMLIDDVSTLIFLIRRWPK